MDLSKITSDIFTKLEQKWLSHCEDKKTRILSIDGGGTKGFIAGSALIHLEHQIQARTGDLNSRISDFIDILAGTGIGALYAAMLTADDGDGRPLFSAKSGVKFVKDVQNRASIHVGPTRTKRQTLFMVVPF